MTNEKAIAELRVILATERQWKEYFAKLSDRAGKRRFKEQSLRVAALEHAITQLGVVEMLECARTIGARKVSSIEAEKRNARHHITSKERLTCP